MKVLAIIFMLVLVGSCKKNPPLEPEPTGPVMPPLTHVGANTFGCYIDGELFVANEGESVWSIPPVSGSFNESDGVLSLLGTRHIADTTDNIRFSVVSIIGEGQYDIEIYDGGIIGYRNWGGGLCDYYYEDILDPGKLTITYLDESKNIISGTFYMNLINSDCAEDTLMKITDGRFDFHY